MEEWGNETGTDPVIPEGPMEPLEQRTGWCLSLNLSLISCGCEKTPKLEKTTKYFF